jgi:RNase P/RNase MRP subunit p29
MLLAGFCLSATAQNSADTLTVKHKVIKQNGVAFVGKIVSQDAREILIETQEIGLVYIPKHEVKEIIELKQGEKPISGGLFATRYFLTTNGFSIKKGDNYVQWNLFGPDFQFGIADNMGVGIMTSWVGIPVIGTFKYTFKLGEGLCGGVGFLGGTGSWNYPEYGLLLPFGYLTLGSRVNNVNVSAGYGALFLERTEYTIINTPTEYSVNSFEEEQVGDSEGRPLLSVACMFRLNNKFSFVFDSFIMLAGRERTRQELQTTYNEPDYKARYSLVNVTEKGKPLVVLSPGLRFQATEHSSFQFGFTGLHVDGEFVPFPIPMVQWFRKI